MKSIRRKYSQPVDRSYNPRFVEFGAPYKDSQGKIYQRYQNGMIRKITEAPVATS